MEASRSSQRVIRAGQILAAAAMLVRIGGYGGSLLPSASASAGILLVLWAAEWFHQHRDFARSWSRAESWARTHWFAIGLTGVVLLALGIRLFGLNEDLGHLPRSIDENRLNTSVISFLRTGEINHSTVEHYPGVHYWLLVGSYLLTYLWGLMSDVAVTLARMPRDLFMATGRLISVLMSVGTVLFVGLLGRRLVDARTGLFAAALLAVAPLSILVGRQLRNDSTQVMLITAAVYVALGINERIRSPWAPLTAGLLVGLAAGVKYTGVFALIPVALAAATTRESSQRVRSLGLVAVGFAGALLLSNHFLWADVPNFVEQLSDQILITDESHWAAQDNPTAFYTRILAQRIVGWPLLLAAAGVSAFQLASRRWSWWVFLSYPLVYIWFASKRPAQLPRWVYPAAPFVVIAAAAGFFVLVTLARRRVDDDERLPRALRLAAAPLAAALFASPMLLATAGQLSRHMSPPTWELAEQWLESNAAGERLLIQQGWLDLPRREYDLSRVRRLEESLIADSHHLAAHDLIVVQEPLLQHPVLSGLSPAATFVLDTSFGGNVGPDIVIFEAPEIPMLEGQLDINPRAPDSMKYLGPEWERRGRAAVAALPASGATIYLPPWSDGGRSIEIVTRGGQRADGAATIEVETASGQLELRTVQLADGEVTYVAELAGNETGAVWLTLVPVGPEDPVEVLRVRLR